MYRFKRFLDSTRGRTALTTWVLLAACSHIQAAAPDLKSVNVLAFGPGNILFAADSWGGAIFALQVTPGDNPRADRGYNSRRIDERIASLLGVPVQRIKVNDMAVHPESKEAYIAVTRGRGDDSAPAIVVVNQADQLRVLDLTDVSFTKASLAGLPSGEIEFWEEIPARGFTITDVDYHGGNIYVSGLSNAEFASTLRKIPYPFTGTLETASVEIYHANHNQRETRAPIRTLAVVNLEGKEHVLAAYTCTPLVTIPLETLEDKAHVVGKTVGELGYGNTPIDLIQYTAQDMEGNAFDVVLLTNKHQSAQVVALADLAGANQTESLSTFAGFSTAGVKFTNIPLVGLLHIDNQDDRRILTLRRNLDDGTLELFSFMKGLYFRVSDFVSEYEFPDYEYATDGSQDFQKGVQNMMKQDEGFTGKVKK